MITVIKKEDRGRTKIDWLDSYHSFSFGDYYDPKNINFGPLRVLNDDTVKPTAGFPTHKHRDMEIVSIVTKGRMAHRDSTGSEGLIRVNDIQRMTAGKGIMHSEFNASDTEILKFYQVWFIPNQQNLTPSYEQITFEPGERKNILQLIVSGDKEDGVVFINQDAKIYLTDLEENTNLVYEPNLKRGIYIHIIEGQINVNGVEINSGDAIKAVDETKINIEAKKSSGLILFDVALDIQ